MPILVVVVVCLPDARLVVFVSTGLPAPVVKVEASRADLLLKALIAVGLGVLIYLQLRERPVGPVPIPDSKVNGVAVGKAYAPALLDSFAAAYEAAAAKLEKGGTMDESSTVAADTFKQDRVESFVKIVGPSLTKVIKPGTEPRDEEHRAEVVKFDRDFAKGLRAGH